MDIGGNMKKYKVRLNHRYGCEAKIQEIEVDRETDKSIWIKGQRLAKLSEYANYYNTWDEAKNALLGCQATYVRSIRLRLESANGALGKIQRLRR